MSSSSEEDHERRHSIDDHHQPSNDAFKIRHESSDSAISSGSGLSPVNKNVQCPIFVQNFKNLFLGIA